MKNVRRVICAVIAFLFIGAGFIMYKADIQNTGERNAYALFKDKYFNSQEDEVNLIICWTPLQMLIAENIMKQHPNEKFRIILISNVKNEKFEHYFNRIKSKSDKAYSFYFPARKENPYYIYTTLLELKIKSLMLPKIKTIFFANLDSPEVHTIASSHPEAQIKTFDDGTANIVENSYLLSDFEFTTNVFYKKIINPIHTTKTIRESSLEHYTIFRDFPNIMDKYSKKITYLPLFEYKREQVQPIKDTVKILLGTLEKDLKQTSELVAEKYKIDFATLHPRQEYKLYNIKTIETELIIEDYLLQELNKNPQTQYEIYTFFSGAALTIKDFPRVKVIALKPTSFPKDYWLVPVYSLFEKAGIPILEFNDK